VSVEATLRRLLPYVVVATGGFILAYLVVLLFVFPPGAPPVNATVPNVLGLSYDDAATRLSTAGFSATRGESRYNVSSPRSTVLAQTPPSGSTEPKGTKVVLDVSAGQRRATVPNVVGFERQQAEVALDKVGLDIGDVVERESPLPRGEVLATSPTAGTAMILPSGVTLTVSAGPATIPVPFVVGRSFAEARAALEQVGLSATSTPDSTATQPTGTVTRQTPPEGTPVGAGSIVRLTVAAGPLAAGTRVSRP
jgi:beta-lactam-binding protein with PASTA domain